MRNESVKGDVELDVFRAFARACALPIDIASAAKCLSPEPDISCQIEGEGRVRFELVEICDANLARVAARPALAEGLYIRTSDPSWTVVEKKLMKRYVTTDPVELLCHVEHRVATPDSTIIPTLKKLLEERTFQFRKVWLHGRKGVHQLWPTV